MPGLTLFRRRRKRPIGSLFFVFRPTLGGAILFLGILFADFCGKSNVDAMCLTLPRISVQFLCQQPLISEGFDATKVFEDFYSTEIFSQKLNQSETNSSDYTISAYSSNYSSNSNQPYDLQLYVSVGINTVRDVDRHEYFYNYCDHDDVIKTLVTIDVRGYSHWIDGYFNNDSSLDDDTWWLWDHGFQDNFEGIREYFQSNVCESHPFLYFRSSVDRWDEDQYPIPPFGESPAAVCGTSETMNSTDTKPAHGGGQAVYPSSSILRYDGLPSQNSASKDAYERRYGIKKGEGGYQYDHDLYELCADPYVIFGNEVEDDEYEAPPWFWLLGILVGYVMVYMIKAEFVRPLRYQQLSGRNSSSNNNNRSVTHNSIANFNNDDDESDDIVIDIDIDDDEIHGHTSQQQGQGIELMTLSNRVIT